MLSIHRLLIGGFIGRMGMTRRAVAIVFAGLALALAAIGAYSLIFEPAPVAVSPPEFTPITHPIIDSSAFEHLAQKDPVAMFAECLSRYTENAKGFSATLEKQERVDGKLHDREVVRVLVWGEVPTSPGLAPDIRVRMVWESGFQKDTLGNTVHATLFPAVGQTDKITTYRANAFVKEWPIDVKGSLARGASRYCIRDSGIYRGMLRTYTAWQKQKDRGELKTEYLGKQVIPQTGGRECHVVKRICLHPDVDSFSLDEQAPADAKSLMQQGFSEVTVMIDVERYLHLGTILKRANGELIGEYYFRDVKLLNEEPAAAEFTIAEIKKVK